MTRWKFSKTYSGQVDQEHAWVWKVIMIIIIMTIIIVYSYSFLRNHHITKSLLEITSQNLCIYIHTEDDLHIYITHTVREYIVTLHTETRKHEEEKVGESNEEIKFIYTESDTHSSQGNKEVDLQIRNSEFILEFDKLVNELQAVKRKKSE